MASETKQQLAAFTQPGRHSHNLRRRMRARGRITTRGWLQRFFLLVAVGCVGYYAFTAGGQYLDQRYENWAFDQEIAGRHVTWRDWVMQITPLGAWTGYQPPPLQPSQQSEARPNMANQPASPPLLPEGTVMGRVAIPRLNLAAMVRQGVSEETLSRAVGHVPSTQGPGAVGNFALAAHRDTLFRALKDIRGGDRVTFQASDGEFDYEVISTKIVVPADVSVLRPRGDEKLLTLITCYPFYFVGSAPKRFIVTAKLIAPPH